MVLSIVEIECQVQVCMSQKGHIWFFSLVFYFKLGLITAFLYVYDGVSYNKSWSSGSMVSDARLI